MPVPQGIRQVEEFLWEFPVSHRAGMRVPARIFADRDLLERMDSGVFEQAVNMAMLPGILGPSLCMPDGHLGYGFPIGGAAAFDTAEGIISPGGIGFDINCGMRLVATNLTEAEVRPRLAELADGLFAAVPSGVGATGSLKLSRDEFLRIAQRGAAWGVENGYGWREDLERTEAGGSVPGADPSAVGGRAVERGLGQIGTLGSGNHYLEVQTVPEDGILDPAAAKAYGITGPGQVLVMFHCGSRGFGHQIATDFLERFLEEGEKRYGIRLPERGLACAPFGSEDGKRYFAAMSCAINVSYANRQVILHSVREVFSRVFGRSPQDLGMHMVYDVSHNTATLETQIVDGKERRVLVHRKGATRALGPGSRGLPDPYRRFGQPVIIGGSMETGSYLLAGTGGREDALLTTAHGSGRIMSRGEAKRRFRGADLAGSLGRRGVLVRCASLAALAEEAGAAYKDLEAVASVAERAGLSRRVARLRPLACVKG